MSDVMQKNSDTQNAWAQGSYINGTWLDGLGQPLASLDPATGESVWQGHSTTDSQVTEAVTAAAAAQIPWQALGLDARKDIIERFAAELTAEKNPLAELICRETGKPHWEALAEVDAMIGKIAISIDAQHQRAGSAQAGQTAIAHRAHGVMAVFGPYNFPGHLPNGHIVPALLAGNTVVFKPSEHTPLTAAFTVELWLRAGLPSRVIQLIQGERETGAALAAAKIDGLLFTGSSATGKHLHQQFGGRPEVLLALEMGGNNPLIASDITSINTAAQHIVSSAFISAGQRCTCARRLILVENKTTDALLDAVLALVDKFIIGPWQATPAPFYGPVIHPQTATQLQHAQTQLLALGGKALRTMAPLALGECFLSPAVIDMTDAKPAPDMEWFGPLLQVYRVATIDDAIRMANNTQYGLAAGLLSDDKSEQTQFMNSIRAGVISINKPTAGASSRLPFGGIGASGNHRASAFYAADYCAWPQAMSIGDNTDQQDMPPLRGIQS
ncbi:succinylglutamate-semialdehyde dehydrogenase [Marinagarivorans algicola]|uniref:succinylglutamate-semialdehyde dehydrogenase n=1 Tax=Marinagarivorans algicola TaxID=1513270 RepID=UPI000B1508CF|nr:succinylglutamate-semialdehyde dehydrogenase [Marinagarivorans algicola]